MSKDLALKMIGEPMSQHPHGEGSSTVDRVATSRGTHARELAWTVAGATAGSLARFWVDRTWPGHAWASTCVVTAIAAAFVGFAIVASIRATMKAVLAAA